MLNNLDLEEKSYERLMTEAMLQIPLYTKEWTNFSPSDPGMTILENLTSFTVLQQHHINQITPLADQKLLEMVGFSAERGRAAKTLLMPVNLKENMHLQTNQKFYLGDVCYETARPYDLTADRLTDMYSLSGGTFASISHLLNQKVHIPAEVFGTHPKAGDGVYFFSDGLPEPNSQITFYFAGPDTHRRIPFAERGSDVFAKLRWECFTEEGFLPMNVRDETGCFLTDGEVRLRLPDVQAAKWDGEPQSGYLIRAVLERADFDIVPKLVQVSGFLFEVWQKQTLSACRTFHQAAHIRMQSDLLKEGYISVYCREEKGGSYRKYSCAGPTAGRGRYFTLKEEPGGTFCFSFDEKKYGFAPAKVKDAIKIVSYGESIMRRMDLGTVYGADHQSISLPMGHVVADSFCIIAERTGQNGEKIYDFVRPNRFGEDDLSYYLYEEEGRIQIEDAGAFIGAKLYVGGFAVTRGEEGNVRPGGTFVMEDQPDLFFVNPLPGHGGRFRETTEEVKSRFLEDLKHPFAAVTAQDYETIVRETPGLCIHKVKAFLDEEQNIVTVAVKPDTEEEFPTLSAVYRQQIENRLQQRRLLTTRIKVVGPVYTTVDVEGCVYVKANFEHAPEQIREAVEKELDCIHTDRNFGETIRFDQVFRAVEALDCVAFVSELSLHTGNAKLARVVESDVHAADNCLCHAGEIRIETVTERI